MNNQSTQVSIITPFYNEEKFLEESIQSVLGQTYENWELLLIDDGSSDGSTDIAKSFASKYSGKINYLNHSDHSNKGSSESRNLGVANAKGELIAFLDADDLFGKEYLQNQVELFNKVDATMICEATIYWHSWADPNKKDKKLEVGVESDQLYKPQELNLKLYPLKKDAAAPCMCGIIVDKKTLKKHSGFVEVFRKNYTDQVFLSKIYFHEYVYISSACNNFYRQRDDSMMANIKDNNDYIKIRTKFLEWFKSYLKENGGTKTDVYKRVNKLLLPIKYPQIYHYFNYLPQKVLNRIRKLVRQSS